MKTPDASSRAARGPRFAAKQLLSPLPMAPFQRGNSSRPSNYVQADGLPRTFKLLSDGDPVERAERLRVSQMNDFRQLYEERAEKSYEQVVRTRNRRAERNLAAYVQSLDADAELATRSTEAPDSTSPRQTRVGIEAPFSPRRQPKREPPLLSEAPSWWKVPPEVVDAANIFDEKLHQFRQRSHQMMSHPLDGNTERSHRQSFIQPVGRAIDDVARTRFYRHEQPKQQTTVSSPRVKKEKAESVQVGSWSLEQSIWKVVAGLQMPVVGPCLPHASFPFSLLFSSLPQPVPLPVCPPPPTSHERTLL